MRLSSAQLAPLRLSGFRNLFFAMLVSSAGTLLAAVALTIDVLNRTNSGPWVAAVVIVEFLPSVLVGLFLGPLLDRLERRTLMIAADALRVGVFAALPFAPNTATIVALAAVAGLANGFFRPAVYAAVPNLVPDAELSRANALLLTVENVSWAVGPLLGGVLSAANGTSTAYVVNAVSFLVSIVFLARIPPRMLQSERALSRGHWRDLRDGFSVTLGSPSMRTVLVAWSIASLATGAANAVEIFLAQHTFSAGDVLYALLYSAMGVGLVLGTFYSATLLGRSGLARTYGASLTLMAMGYVGAAASPNIWVASGCVLVAGFGNGAAIACNALLVQRGTFDLMRGRALTFVMSITFVLVGIGNLAGGVLLAPTGPRWIWGACGLMLLGAALAGYLLARRLRGETPAEAEVQSESTPVAAAH
ncbi:MAG TPA: MFS transporter [Gaiellaceae bacterium]|nr:MFS transporter [Gaiellaceae bacterium]